MSYEVIARKYRPQRFDDVVGQDHVIQTLRNAIERGRIAHAYLFSGPRGTGKTTLARIFSKCLNCDNGPSSNFSEDDPRCSEISEGRSLDVIEIDGASNRGIDEIRELRETARYAPSSSRYKIYIIDEVHMLTKEAFNALLKTLEEPPDHVKFMFATTEPERVLPTILSRCQRFDLRRIPNPLIAENLGRICELESVAISKVALLAIARGSDGGMRDAESTLDQLISFCGDRIEEADVLSMFGLSSKDQLRALAQAILEGEAGRALAFVEELTREGVDLGRLLSELMGHFRSLLILSLSGSNSTFLELGETDSGALAEQLEMGNTGVFSRILESLVDAESKFRMAISKRIALEVGLMRAIDARYALPIEEAIGSLRALREGDGLPEVAISRPSPRPMEARASSEASTPPRESVAREAEFNGSEPAASEDPQINPLERSETPTEPAAPDAEDEAAVSSHTAAARKSEDAPQENPEAPENNLAVSDPPSGGMALVEVWQTVTEELRRAKGFVATLLRSAHLARADRNEFVIAFPPEALGQLALADNERTRAALGAALNELGMGTPEISMIEAPRPEDWPPLPEERDPDPDPEPKETPAAPRIEENASEGIGEVSGAEPLAPDPSSVTPEKMDPEEFASDPLIEEAMRVFRARIVDVRPPTK